MGPTFGRQDVRLRKDGLRRKNQHQKDDVAGEDDYQSHARHLRESCQQNDERALATIEGKWWTSGNGFGDSEVVFTQNGSNVSGVIRYADGRTGTVNGTMAGNRLQHTWTNSSGDGGTGWLELSWNNFLGGPWHNQKVRDGSWTLMRVEGKWCFGGSAVAFAQSLIMPAAS